MLRMTHLSSSLDFAGGKIVMTLSSLIYCSEPRINGVSQVEDIMNAAVAANAKRSVTGLLCFSSDHFLQLLEGDRTILSELFVKIANDDRHRAVTLLDYREIDGRECPEWSMRYVPIAGALAPNLLRYASARAFDPTRMSVGALRGFMRELALAPAAARA